MAGAHSSFGVELGKVLIHCKEILRVGVGRGQGLIIYPTSGWPGTHCVVRAGLEFGILPCQPPEHWSAGMIE